MSQEAKTSELLRRHEQEVLAEWIRLQQQNLSLRNNLLRPEELEEQCRQFLRTLLTATPTAPHGQRLTKSRAGQEPKRFHIRGFAGPADVPEECLGTKEVARLSYKSDDGSIAEFFSHASMMHGAR